MENIKLKGHGDNGVVPSGVCMKECRKSKESLVATEVLSVMEGALQRHCLPPERGQRRSCGTGAQPTPPPRRVTAVPPP